MCNSLDNQLLAVENGAIPHLVGIFDRSLDDEVAQTACESIQHLSKGCKHSQEVMHDEGVIEQLIKLIQRGGHTKSCCAAVAALGGVVEHNKRNQNKARDSGAIVEIAELLHAGPLNPVRRIWIEIALLIEQ